MQALRVRLAFLLAGSSLFRATCTRPSARQADSLSLMQISVLKANGSEVSTGAFHSGLMMMQVSSEAMLHIPGVKSMAEQLKEGAKYQPPPPEPGFHQKLVKALPLLKEQCYHKLYATKEDCTLAIRMVMSMIKYTDGPEPVWTWHGQIRAMLGLNYWLYSPGTTMCFPMLDRDQSGNVTLEEMTMAFGVQMVKGSQAIWEFMDQNNDGGFTREELHQYLRACIMIREYLPEVDAMDTKADSKKCLNMAHRVLNAPPAAMARLGFYPKLLSIAGIVVGAVAIHCLFCQKRGSKTAQPDGPPVGAK